MSSFRKDVLMTGQILRVPILGVDIEVITDRFINTTMGNEEFLPINGAFEALRKLHEKFNGKIVIVSSASISSRKHIYAWLGEQHFHKATGISLENVEFCLQVSGITRMCQETQITHFISSRLRDLYSLQQAQVPSLYLLGGNEEEMRPYNETSFSVIRTGSWKEVLEKILS